MAVTPLPVIKVIFISGVITWRVGNTRSLTVEPHDPMKSHPGMCRKSNKMKRLPTWKRQNTPLKPVKSQQSSEGQDKYTPIQSIRQIIPAHIADTHVYFSSFLRIDLHKLQNIAKTLKQKSLKTICYWYKNTCYCSSGRAECTNTNVFSSWLQVYEWAMPKQEWIYDFSHVHPNIGSTGLYN